MSSPPSALLVNLRSKVVVYRKSLQTPPAEAGPPDATGFGNRQTWRLPLPASSAPRRALMKKPEEGKQGRVESPPAWPASVSSSGVGTNLSLQQGTEQMGGAKTCRPANSPNSEGPAQSQLKPGCVIRARAGGNRRSVFGVCGVVCVCVVSPPNLDHSRRDGGWGS